MTDNDATTGPVIKIRMGFPTLLGAHAGERAGVTLEISDEVSRLAIAHLCLNDEQFRDLFAGREVVPTIEFVNPHPERWGHAQTMWTESFRDEREALVFKAALEAQGWSVGKPQRTNPPSYVVTGRRWDGEEAGTYCRKHRRMPPRLHVCYDCAVAP